MKLFIICYSFLFATLLSAQTYINPVLTPGVFKDANNRDVTINSTADPGVFKDTDGTYYLYVTGRGYPCFSSKDLVNWKYEGQSFRANTAKWAVTGFWAPEVIKINNKYYMNYTAAHSDNIKHIGIAVSDSPVGPFVDLSDTPFIDHGDIGTIDSHIFVDDDGRTYLYYSNAMSTNPIPELGGKGRSEVWVVEVTPDLTEQISQHQLLIYPTQNWEFNPNSNSYWNEGAAVLKHKGLYYLLFSANCYCNANYSVGYATSKSPMGPFTKSPYNPILSNAGVSKYVSGTGHNSVVRSPDDSELFIVYHSHVYVGQLNSSNNGIRQVNIDRMLFLADGSIVVKGPSVSQQPVPSFFTDVQYPEYQSLEVFPTLVEDKVMINREINNTDAELFITSILGQVINLPVSADSTVDLSAFPQGIYHLILIENGQYYKTKIIKR